MALSQSLDLVGKKPVTDSPRVDRLVSNVILSSRSALDLVVWENKASVRLGLDRLYQLTLISSSALVNNR